MKEGIIGGSLSFVEASSVEGNAIERVERRVMYLLVHQVCEQ